eukprot:TRINITY_DN777917_c0_g1_i1.p1 TRINITY_DN777917_c0_g1~~TRINITY_DN777917_c0_g1_i1.p1  ORF type:complete len:178 (+),score=30.29 TRINITY_DN777917_c0_g1_i1:64-534(+)
MDDDDTLSIHTEDEEKLEQEPPKKKRTIQRRPKFSHDHLLSEKGLDVVFRDFPKMKFRKKEQVKRTNLLAKTKFGKRSAPIEAEPAYRTFESENLQKLLLAYSKWTHKMYPGVSFPDMVNKIDKLASTNIVKERVREMKLSHYDRLEREEREQHRL